MFFCQRASQSWPVGVSRNRAGTASAAERRNARISFAAATVRNDVSENSLRNWRRFMGHDLPEGGTGRQALSAIAFTRSSRRATGHQLTTGEPKKNRPNCSGRQGGNEPVVERDRSRLLVGLLVRFGRLGRLGFNFRRGHRITDGDFVADYIVALGGFVYGNLPCWWLFGTPE